jgi:cell division septation protein DedD
MRSFFWLLVVVNLAYVGWRLFGAELVAESSGPTAPPAAAHPLTLLSELPQPPEPRAATAAPAQQDQELLQDQDDQPHESGGMPGPNATPEPEPERAASAQAPLESERVCAVVAGFTASDSALVLVQALKGVGIDAFTVSGDAQAASVWWVYLPKFASEELARRTLAELRGKGIDSYYLNSGELEGGISLGVFARKDGAVRTQEALAKRGYSASVQETSRPASRYRVVVESTPQVLQAQPVMHNFLEKNQGLDVSDFVCEGVAVPK